MSDDFLEPGQDRQPVEQLDVAAHARACKRQPATDHRPPAATPSYRPRGPVSR